MRDKKPILLVEDNPDDVELTIRALKKNNISNEIVHAKDGEEALEILMGTSDEGSEPLSPAMVLLDLNLPKINGLEVLEKIRQDERLRLLPVIILTSSKEESDLVRGYSLGANSYIVKPVDFHQFSDAVKSLGLYWLVVNQPPPMKE